MSMRVFQSGLAKGKDVPRILEVSGHRLEAYDKWRIVISVDTLNRKKE